MRRPAGSEEEDGFADGTDANGGESDGDSEGLGAAARWKGNLLERAAALFSPRGADLAGYIYGQKAVVEVGAGIGTEM